MKYSELVHIFNRHGVVFDRQARGSHEIWRSRVNGRRTTVPNHGSKDLHKGTVHTILRDLGIDKDDL